jgi:DNA-binding MarR family transcriptional regulator
MALNGTVGYMLAQLCKLHRQHADALLNRVGLHVGQEMLLNQLWQSEGLNQSQLAERILLQPATVTNMLRRLERAGVVERRKDVDDQRISRVYVSAKGKELEPIVGQLWNRLEEQTFGDFTLEERVLLRRLLQHAYRNLADWTG